MTASEKTNKHAPTNSLKALNLKHKELLCYTTTTYTIRHVHFVAILPTELPLYMLCIKEMTE